MMQFKQIFMYILAGMVIVSACSKRNETPAVDVPIDGVWTGKSSVLSEPYNNFFSFRITSPGLLERLDAEGKKTGEGTWAFYNNKEAITGTFTLTNGSTFSVIATFDKVNGKLSGTWGNGAKEYGGGYWYMYKSK